MLLAGLKSGRSQPVRRPVGDPSRGGNTGIPSRLTMLTDQGEAAAESTLLPDSESLSDMLPMLDFSARLPFRR